MPIGPKEHFQGNGCDVQVRLHPEQADVSPRGNNEVCRRVTSAHAFQVHTSDRPAAPIPSLVIHLIAAVAAAAPSALLATPTAFRRLDVAKLVPSHPVMCAGTAHSWNGR